MSQFAPQSTLHSTLVDTATLEAHLVDITWVVFDCRHDLAAPRWGREAYAAGHVPGAQFVHLDEDLSGVKSGSNGRHPLPEAGWFAARMAERGVGVDTQVVAYDAHGGMYASRLWWMLRWIGHQAVAVLDGGWSRWVSEGRPQLAGATATGTAMPQSAGLPVRPGAPVSADAAYLLAHLGQPGMRLIDARSPDRFHGENETMDPVGGRIPGAVNRCFRDNLGDDGGFKPAAQLRTEFAGVLGAAQASEVVHQCGSGVSACHNILAMEIAGLPGSRLYPGSWSEWCADPSRPVERG